MSDMSNFDRFKVTYQKGDIIFCEYEPGDTFYLIQSGSVQIVKIINDMEKIVDILAAGEIFGEMAILENAPRSATAIAAEKVEVLEFTKGNFEILMKGNPQIAFKLLQTFIKRIYEQKRRFMILTLEESQAKVADVLLMLAETQYVESRGPNEKVVKTNPEEIGNWCGLDCGECENIIALFQRQKKIEVSNDKIVIKDLGSLSRYVNSRRNR